MGKLLVTLALVIGGGFLIWKLTCKCTPPKPPHLSVDEWWGPKQMIGKVEHNVRPFKVKFSEAMIKDLRHRLTTHRPFTPPLEGVAMEYGMNTDQLTDIVNYWANDYPFEKREQFLNQFQQFKTNIQGLDIHFIRVKPQTNSGVTVVPILLLHGWPGSVREFYETIPMLTKPRPGYNFVFEVVAPSLPGYGFSDAAVRPGLGAGQMSVVMRNLMHRLGHKKFFVQGGDWGAAIGSAMSTLFPDDVLGFHTNLGFVQNNCAITKMVLGALMPSMVVDEKLTDRMYPLSSFFAYLLEEFGYMHLQATKPDTVGVGVSDSPAGLAAYVLEKFAGWTVRKAKEIPSKWSKDALLDNLMFYWVPNSMTTSMRLYAETMSIKHIELKLDSIPTPVPTWVMQAKHELFYQPPGVLRTKFVNLINTTVLDDGGHFLAFEKPKELTDDVFKAVHEFRTLHEETKKTEL